MNLTGLQYVYLKEELRTYVLAAPQKGWERVGHRETLKQKDKGTRYHHLPK